LSVRKGLLSVTQHPACLEK